MRRDLEDGAVNVAEVARSAGDDVGEGEGILVVLHEPIRQAKDFVVLECGA
jgi:hypothetical protein